MGIKKWLFLIPMLVLLAASCSKQKPISQTNSANSSPTGQQADKTTGWKIYTNNEYGFTLQLPAARGYIVKNVTGEILPIISFELPTKDPNWLKSGNQTGAVFSVVPYTYSEYQKMLDDCKKPDNKDFQGCSANQIQKSTVGKNGKYYFMYTRIDQATDYPPDFTIDMFEQADQIIKTFKVFDLLKPGQVYENEFMKVTVPAGWAAKQANKTVYYGSCVNKGNCTTTPKVEPNPAAVNITKGSYILYINTQAAQASGAEGGRFAEIAMGAPSADAVVIDQPSPPCGTSEKFPAMLDHPRVDLYVSSRDKLDYCHVPLGSRTVWYFSYITNASNWYFNYYQNGEPPGFVITMAYNSKNVDNLPVKGSTGLNQMLDEMTGIVKSLQIKQQ